LGDDASIIMKMTSLFFRHVIRLRRRLHLLFTCVSLAFVIIVCMHAIEDQRDRKLFNGKSPAGDGGRAAAESRSNCQSLVHFRRETPIIWIGGVPRSGTTLMRAILDAHPDVRCGAESRVIPRMLGLHQNMERSEAEMTWLRSARVTNDTLDRALGAYLLTVIARSYVDDDDSRTDADARRSPEAESESVRLCSKDPFALRSMQRLLRVFPSSLFLLLVRDGRAVADSIVSGHVTIRGFDVTSRRGALADWNRVMSMMYSQCLAVGAERCLPVHYEQLVLAPEEQMRKILKFVGVPWNDVVLRHETTIGHPDGIYLSQ
jgi:protein-tyrosine sulfotransferase